MQIKYFTVSVLDNGTANDELNRFLRSHRVLDVQQEFVAATSGAYWCVSVKYLQGDVPANTGRKEKPDYRRLLKEEVFQIFEQLRVIRKQIAKNDAVPAYAVFTDEELVEIAKLEEITSPNIKKIKGIGDKKTEKYGASIVEAFAAIVEQKPLGGIEG